MVGRFDSPKVQVRGLGSVCLSVSLSLVMRMYCGKTAGPIEMPFGTWSWVGHSNHVLDVGPDLPRASGYFGVGMGRPIIKYRELEPSSARKRMARSRWLLACGCGWPK